MLYDAFICHASEDKASFVRPLAKMLSKHHLTIWYDEFSLNVGDSLRQAIDQGLAESRFGIVVLSPAFFRKGWPQRELDGLVARQVSEDRRLILPIWHNITQAELLRVSPPLAGVVAINSADGIKAVCRSLLKKIRPEESPLIAARDELIRRGIEPPVISDEWWLDIVEASNRIPAAGPVVPDESVWGTWTFPLPYQGETGSERGLNLAWTAMQLRWSEHADKHHICQITRPDLVHSFINDFPGLAELCHKYPNYLACYAPQLTITDFSGPFATSFDKMLAASEERQRRSQSGAGLTRDGKTPLCDEEIALRHPTFGNYNPSYVACFYVQGEIFGPTSKCFEHVDYLVWLLSGDSAWLPEAHREFLIAGMREWAVWASGIDPMGVRANAFIEKLHSASGVGTFRFTKQVKAGLDDVVGSSLARLGIQGSVKRITDAFIRGGFVQGFFESQEHRTKRNKH